MARPTFTPAQRKLQDELLSKFENGNRREVRKTLNSLKKQFGGSLHETVKALRAETDGRKLRKLGREATETRRMIQTIENVKRRIGTITENESKKKTTQKVKPSKSSAATAMTATETATPDTSSASAATQAEAQAASTATPVPSIAAVKEAITGALGDVLAETAAALAAQK